MKALFLFFTLALPGLSLAQSYRFAGDPKVFTIDPTLHVGLGATRCSQDQLPDNAAAIARQDWADRCLYVSKAEWAKNYANRTHTRTGALIPREKLAYPIFVHDATNEIWKPDDLSQCNMPADVVFFTICEAGCFTGDQKLAFHQSNQSREIAIADAYRTYANQVSSAQGATQDELKLMTLRPGSSLDAMSFIPTEIFRFLVSAQEEMNEILTLRTQSGNEIKVTPDHPLIDRDGAVRKAAYFEEGEELVRADGSLDAISSISSTLEFGRVYNVEPVGKTSTEHVIVAQGFLAGSLALQNGDISDLQRVFSRKNAKYATLNLE